MALGLGQDWTEKAAKEKLWKTFRKPGELKTTLKKYKKVYLLVS